MNTQGVKNYTSYWSTGAQAPGAQHHRGCPICSCPIGFFFLVLLLLFFGPFMSDFNELHSTHCYFCVLFFQSFHCRKKKEERKKASTMKVFLLLLGMQMLCQLEGMFSKIQQEFAFLILTKNMSSKHVLSSVSNPKAIEQVIK